MILALDTTSEFGSIAIVRRDEVVEEIPLHAPDGFGHVLFEHLRRMLDRNGIRMDAMQAFAAASGPGSFTGVRVGLAAVKGLAEVLHRPAVTVSNLQALAWFGSAPLRATLLDARRGEVYGAIYDNALQLVSEEVVMRFPDWLAAIPKAAREFISTDFGPFRSYLDPAAILVTAPRALAGAVGRIAWQRLDSGAVCDPASVEANYVRRSDAELFWKE